MVIIPFGAMDKKAFEVIFSAVACSMMLAASVSLLNQLNPKIKPPLAIREFLRKFLRLLFFVFSMSFEGFI